MVRIRKNALKLLGSDYLYTLPPPPPLPPPAAEWWDPQCGGGGGGEEVIPCRLNCSPWDVLVGPNSSWFQEEEEGRDIMGNGLKFEEYEEIMATFESIPSSNAEGGNNGATTDGKKKKTTRIRKRKEEGNKINGVALAKSRPVVVICSKNDGKGWHCKRPANPRHTLCNHHLDLLRSYSLRTNSNSNSKRESCVDNSETDHEPQVKNQIWPMAAENHRPKAVAAAATETAGDGFYYYYSGFGPWRGKKRSSTARANDDEKRGEERMNESGDGSDGPVAGDDLDDDDEDDEMEDGIENCGRVLKKKRRKRVKARSLKSLM